MLQAVCSGTRIRYSFRLALLGSLILPAACTDRVTSPAPTEVESDSARFSPRFSSSPGRVDDLAMAANGPNALTLRFTEVDNGIGGSASYELHLYDPSVGSSGNATPRVTEGTCANLVGKKVGQTLECEVRGLAPDTIYAFAMKAYRGTGSKAVFGNWSNVAVGTTTAARPVALDVRPDALSLHTLGESVPLTLVMTGPGGETMPTGGVTLSSTDTMVAVVLSDLRQVVAVGVGKAAIVATAACCSLADTVPVEVDQLSAYVDVTPATVTMDVGATAKLTATATDSNGSPLPDVSVTWASSDTSVARVDPEGRVTGVAAGTATVTAETSSAQKSAGALSVQGAAGAPSVQASAKITVGAPPTAKALAIAGVEVVSATSNSLTVRFTQVDNGRGAPASYDIGYYPTAIGQSEASRVSQGSCASPVAGTKVGAVLTCTISELAAATSYDVQLVAFRGTFNVDATYGELSKPVTGTTAAPGLSIATTTLAPGRVGRAYSDSVKTSSGTAKWALVGGALPAGVKISTTGIFSGTPTKAGTFQFTVKATGANGQTAQKKLSITIAQPVLTLTGSSLPGATVGTSYQTQLAAGGGDGTYGWSVQSGKLPGGLSLGASTGKISGAPTAAGSFTATVQVTSGDGQSASRAFAITVSEAPSSGGGGSTGGGGAAVGECDASRPEWIWCDDFERDRLGSYYEHGDPTSFSRKSAVGVDGSTGMEAHFGAGQTSAGDLKVAFGRVPSSYFSAVEGGTANYREVYWRMYVRNDPTWSGGGGGKLSRATIFAKSDWSQAAIGHVWTGDPSSNNLMVDPASGTSTNGVLETSGYNDFNNLRWLGGGQGATPIFDASHVGKWYCVEAHMRLNDAGQSNGVLEYWIDGRSGARVANLNWVGSYSDYGINSVFVENYWNDGSPKAQSRYIDNFVVSTAPIGCGSASAPPPPPPPPPPPATKAITLVGLSIAPAQVDLAPGASQQFVVTGSYTDGSEKNLTTSVTFGGKSGGSTNGSGVYTAGASAGTYQVTASSSGKSASAQIQIIQVATSQGNQDSQGSQGSHEPAGYSVLTDRAFDSYATSRSDASGAAGWLTTESRAEDGRNNVSIVTDATAPLSPNKVARLTYPSGMPGGGAPATAEVDFKGVKHFYQRFAFKLSDNFQGHLTSTNKLFHLWVGASNRVFYSAEGRGSDKLIFTPRLQGTPDSRDALAPNVGNGAEIVRGRWYTVEVLVELNTFSGSTANADGVYRVWINGTLTHDYRNVRFVGSGEGSATMGILEWSPTWGGLDDTVKQTMYMDLDHAYASGR